MTDSPNVALVRRALELWNAGDREGMRALTQPDFHLDLTVRVMNPDTYEGEQGLDRFQDELHEAWEQMRLEPLEFLELGNSVVVRMRSRLVGRGSGVPLESEVTHVWTVRDGLLAGTKLFRDHDEALRFAAA